jgi:membrane protease YdiL (CAAX protease family)
MEPISSETSSAPSPRSSSRERWALLAWLAFTGVLVVLAFVAAGADDGDEERQVFFEYEFAIGSTVAYAILVGLTLMIARLFDDPREALGLRRFAPRMLWASLGVAVGGLLLAGLLEPIFHAGREQGLTPEEWEAGKAPAFVLSAIVVVGVAPFAEELLYRGLGIRVLAFAGSVTAVVVTAFVFALQHGILAALPALGLFAIGLGWLRIRSESLWPPVVAHAAYNLTGVIVALAQSLGAEAVGTNFLL